jgi:hypothetical protein
MKRNFIGSRTGTSGQRYLSQLDQFDPGCPGLEPGARRMEWIICSFSISKEREISPQTVLAILIAHGFPHVIDLFPNHFSSRMEK